jgi:hypothetical protein
MGGDHRMAAHPGDLENLLIRQKLGLTRNSQRVLNRVGFKANAATRRIEGRFCDGALLRGAV